MTEVYCVKCRRKTPSTDVRETQSKNGRPMIKCKCKECGTTKCRFI